MIEVNIYLITILHTNLDLTEIKNKIVLAAQRLDMISS